MRFFPSPRRRCRHRRQSVSLLFLPRVSLSLLLFYLFARTHTFGMIRTYNNLQLIIVIIVDGWALAQTRADNVLKRPCTAKREYAANEINNNRKNENKINKKKRVLLNGKRFTVVRGRLFDVQEPPYTAAM